MSEPTDSRSCPNCLGSGLTETEYGLPSGVGSAFDSSDCYVCGGSGIDPDEMTAEESREWLGEENETT